MSMLTLYLLSVAINLGDVLYALAVVFGGFSFCLLIFVFILSVDYDPDEMRKEKRLILSGKFLKHVVPVFIISVSLHCFVPSKAMIAAMCIVPYVTNIEGIANLPPEIIKATSKLLKEYLADGEKK